MDRFYKRIGLTLSLLAILTDPGFGYDIIEGPQNLTILANSDARFNCTVSGEWKIIIWLFDGQPKLSVLSSGETIRTEESYNQQGHRNGTLFTSELIIYHVQQNDSGQIKCSTQNGDDKYAFLSVQVNGSLNIKDKNFTVRKYQTIEIVCEALRWAPAPHIFWMENNISLDNSMYVTNQLQGLNGLYYEESTLILMPMINVTVTCLAAIDALSKPQYATVTLTVYEPPTIKSGKNEDWRTRTIILAVVLSIVGLLLLILIILLIICCCKRRKDSKKELRKASEKKPPDRDWETMSHNGKDNYGYSPEEKKHAKETKRDPTFFPVYSNNHGPKQDLKVSPPSEVAYNGRHDGVLASRTPSYPVNPRKIRNVTHV